MPAFEPKPGQEGILQHHFLPERTFAVQEGTLHVTGHEYDELGFAKPQDVVDELGRLGIATHPNGAVEVHIYPSENPKDKRTTYVSTNPDDPFVEIRGKRVV